MPDADTGSRRSIPAWAGETSAAAAAAAAAAVYPRVGGGNRFLAHLLMSARGLSPRGRGKPIVPSGNPACRRSIPAWAGETPESRCISWKASVYPRVGGGNRTSPSAGRNPTGLSPRGRGKRIASLRSTISSGSIPAWAGETDEYRGIAYGG